MKAILEASKVGYLFVAVILAFLISAIIPTQQACAKQPTRHSIQNNQVGQASWYGGFHHGRLMANGKRFNMYANTVAHRTLPLGTVVTVTNRNNGRSVTATVTDRGPYAKQRVLDVSRGIANKLDMLKTGTASVEISVMSLPEPKKSKYQRTVEKAEVTPNLNQLDSIAGLINELEQPLLVQGNLK